MNAAMIVKACKRVALGVEPNTFDEFRLSLLGMAVHTTGNSNIGNNVQ